MFMSKKFANSLSFFSNHPSFTPPPAPNSVGSMRVTIWLPCLLHFLLSDFFHPPPLPTEKEKEQERDPGLILFVLQESGS